MYRLHPGPIFLFLDESFGDLVDVACAHGDNRVASDWIGLECFLYAIKRECFGGGAALRNALREYLARDTAVVYFARGINRRNEHAVGVFKCSREFIKKVACPRVEMRMKRDVYLPFRLRTECGECHSNRGRV